MESPTAYQQNLRTAFNEECRINGESACKVRQKLDASYVVSSRMKRHALGNTMSKLVDVPFVIKKMEFNQYVQSRPRRLVRKEAQVDATLSEKVNVEQEKKLNDLEKQFRRVAEQWNLHRLNGDKWKRQWIKIAQKWKGNVSSAKLVLNLAMREGIN